MTKAFPNRKDSIIFSAIDIINELGIQGLSMKELAYREEVAESALYRHYKNKDDIIVAVLEYFSSFDDAIINSIKSKYMSAKDSIGAFFRAYMEYYENYPAITSVFCCFASLVYEDSMKERLGEINKTRTGFLMEAVTAGQHAGEFSSDLTAEEIVTILLGTQKEYIAVWRMQGCSYSLKEKTLSAIQKLLNLI